MSGEEDAPRLYLVTPDLGPRAALDAEAFAPRLAGAVETGLVACVRLDLAAAEEEDWVRAVNHLLPVCHGADVPLVVAERHDLVERLGLDGVHLVRSGASIRELRRSLGNDRIIGAHGGAERHRAMTLAEAGADYVSLGPVAAEDGRAAADAALFQWWSEMIETPVVAEGGVSLEHARALAAFTDFAVPDPEAVWADPAGALPAYAAALA
ncbi:MAG: thiamine phosphate synthase [Pseudomonadota bacterium]